MANWITLLNSEGCWDLDTLPTWGPEFRVSFELYINSFPNTNTLGYAEVIRFTGSDSNFGSYEDRIPGFLVHNDGKIAPAHFSCLPACPLYASNLNTWYKIDLQQYLKNKQVKTGQKSRVWILTLSFLSIFLKWRLIIPWWMTLLLIRVSYKNLRM